MRIKHNKKRNTAFLYECLVKELTLSVLKRNTARKKKILSIMKEFFVGASPLKDEIKYFNMILSETSLDAPTAERLLWEVKSQYWSNIRKNEVFRAQSALIKKINTILGKEVYNNFVPNYKRLATVNAIFNADLAPKDKVIFEGNTIKAMMSKDTDSESPDRREPIDNLVYKSFVGKFNEMYGDSLLAEQKDLVSRYIVSFQDNDVGLKIYLSEEISRLCEQINKHKSDDYLKEDQSMSEKVATILDILESFKEKTIDTGLVEDVLRIQQLVHEMSSP